MFYSFIKTFSHLPRTHQFFPTYRRPSFSVCSAFPSSLHTVATNRTTCLLFQIYHLQLSSHLDQKYYLCFYIPFTCYLCHSGYLHPQILGYPKFCKFLLILCESRSNNYFSKNHTLTTPAAFSEHKIYTFIIDLPFKNYYLPLL